MTTYPKFADQVAQAVQAAQEQDAFRLSPAQIENALMPLVRGLWEMPQAAAHAHIRESFRHEGYQALAVRLYKNESQTEPTRSNTRANGQPLDTEE